MSSKRPPSSDRRIVETIIRAMMSSKDGRRYLWLQLSSLHIFHSTFTSAPGGVRITDFKEGQRAVGLRLFSDITSLCPSEFALMLTENGTKTEEQTNEYRDSLPDADSDADAGFTPFGYD